MELAPNPAWRLRLDTLLVDFDKRHTSNFDVTFYYDHYFVPVNNFCLAYLTAGHKPTPTFHTVAIATRDGKQVFELIKAQNQQIAEDFEDDDAKITQWLAELKNLIAPLLKDF
jgi:hypothetical protein